MILAIDIGNTNINIALMTKRGKIAKRYAKPTNQSIKPILKKIKAKIEKVIIVSVVPGVAEKVKSNIRGVFKDAKVYIVGRNIKVPLRCKYNKKEIGQDRLVTAFAAERLYGAPVLIIDFGTAVTFDAVSKERVYIGGLILPGIKMSFDSLAEKAAMLPKAHLQKTKSFIGRNTKDSIRNGMVYGYASICEGLVDLFKKRVAKNIKVIATGGDASLIKSYTNSVKKVDLNLAFKGLYLLSKKK